MYKIINLKVIINKLNKNNLHISLSFPSLLRIKSKIYKSKRLLKNVHYILCIKIKKY